MSEEVEVKQDAYTFTGIVNDIKEIVINHLCIEEDDKGYDLTFPFESFGADDLDHDEIIMKVEEKFGLEFDDAECARIRCTKDLIDIVVETLGVSPEEAAEEAKDEQEELEEHEEKKPEEEEPQAEEPITGGSGPDEEKPEQPEQEAEKAE